MEEGEDYGAISHVLVGEGKLKARNIKGHLPGDELASLLQCRLKLPRITKDSASAACRKS